MDVHCAECGYKEKFGNFPTKMPEARSYPESENFVCPKCGSEKCYRVSTSGPSRKRCS